MTYKTISNFLKLYEILLNRYYKDGLYSSASILSSLVQTKQHTLAFIIPTVITIYLMNWLYINQKIIVDGNLVTVKHKLGRSESTYYLQWITKYKTKIKSATFEITKTEKGITINVLLQPSSENMEIHPSQKKMGSSQRTDFWVCSEMFFLSPPPNSVPYLHQQSHFYLFLLVKLYQITTW